MKPKLSWFNGTCLASILLFAPTAWADDHVWNAGTSDWFSGGNWLPAAVPAAGDTATINNGGTATIDGPTADLVFLRVGEGTGSGALVVQDGGTLDTSAVTIGSGFSGAAITGDITVTGAGSQLNAFGMSLGTAGNGGEGILTINDGGTVDVQTNAALTSGTIKVDGGSSSLSIATSFDVNDLLEIDNGATVNAPGGIDIATTDLTHGHIEVGGDELGAPSGILNTPNVHGGSGGSRTATLSFTHTQFEYYFTDDGTSGGTPVLITGNTHVRVVRETNSFGTTILSAANTYTGGTTIDWGTLRAGTADALPANTAYSVGGNDGLILGGTLDLNDFDLTVSSLSGDAVSGKVDLGSADLTVDQAGDTTFRGRIVGSGRLIKQGPGTLTLSGHPSFPHTYTGSTSLRNGTLIVDNVALNQGSGGTGVGVFDGEVATLVITGGGVVNNNTAIVGVFAGSNGTVTVDGATSAWVTTNNVQVGDAGTGTLNLFNGGLASASSIRLATSATGTGTVNIGNGDVPGFVDALLIGQTPNSTTNFNHAAADYWFTSDGTPGGAPAGIVGHMTVNHNGTGTTTLLDTNSYTQPTTVNAGTLRVDGAVTNSTITVKAGATLGGNGTVDDVVIEAGGNLAPGSSPGALSVDGNLNLVTGSTMSIEIGGPTPGVEHDQLNVTGNVTLAGTLDVTPLPDPDTVDDTPLGTTFDILTYTTRTGFFETINGTLLNTAFALAPLINETDDTLQLRATIPGDLNLDNKVSVADLSFFALNFGSTPGLHNETDNQSSWRYGDFNSDGQITVADLSLLALNFGFELLPDGSTTSPTSLSLTQIATLAGIDPTDIPEPTTLSTLFALALTPISRRCKHKNPQI